MDTEIALKMIKIKEGIYKNLKFCTCYVQGYLISENERHFTLNREMIIHAIV
jgi:hypothetical protein